LKIW
jgi:hypothetical protein